MSFDLKELPKVSFSTGLDCCYVVPKRSVKKKEFFFRGYEKFIEQNWFADVVIEQDDEGFYFFFDLQVPYQESLYPNYKKGDAIELFLDTRKNLNSATTHRYAHHLLYLPQKVGELQWVELTRFRGHELRPFISTHLLEGKTEIGKEGYQVELFVPKKSLFGYQPALPLGFAYRIHRFKGKPQEFPFKNEQIPFDGVPACWTSLIV